MNVPHSIEVYSGENVLWLVCGTTASVNDTVESDELIEDLLEADDYNAAREVQRNALAAALAAEPDDDRDEQINALKALDEHWVNS